MDIKPLRREHGAVRRGIPLFLLALCMSACAGESAPPENQDTPSSTVATAENDSGLSGKKVYELMCSMCHGENGDGKGIVVLKTKARSFIDGGYSFGNTPEAVYKTISNGIGGTEMPAFKDSLTEQERRAVTEYVLAFNPENSKQRTGDPIMRVADTPLIARGHLPSVSEIAPEHPRGLIVGTTDGLSWEYRADDLRLLAVRKGDFVERADWGGRGGTPLKPLGEIIWLNQNGDPPPPWKLITKEGEVELIAKLAGTTVLDGRAVVRAQLEDANSQLLGYVDMWGSSIIEGGEIVPIRNFRLIGFTVDAKMQYEDKQIDFFPGYPIEFSK